MVYTFLVFLKRHDKSNGCIRASQNKDLSAQFSKKMCWRKFERKKSERRKKNDEKENDRRYINLTTEIGLLYWYSTVRSLNQIRFVSILICTRWILSSIRCLYSHQRDTPLGSWREIPNAMRERNVDKIYIVIFTILGKRHIRWQIWGKIHAHLLNHVSVEWRPLADLPIGRFSFTYFSMSIGIERF